jgi:hypothetical protein
MKRFILGTLAGILIVAAIVTMLPERAHTLIDQAGDVRNMLNDVVNRLEQMEQRDSPQEIVRMELVESEIIDLPAESQTIELLAEEAFDQGSLSAPVFVGSAEVAIVPAITIPESVERQSMNFDNLAEGLARVSGALERLNRTMKPGTRSKPRPEADSTTIDGDAS